MRSWILGLAVCLAVAGFFSTYKLSESPKTWFDEGVFMQVARNIHFGGYFYRVSPSELIPGGLITTVGDPVILPVSLSFKLFGIGYLQARLPMVLYILLFVAAVYLYTRKLGGTQAAWWAGLLVATHPPVYGNGKNVLGEVPGMAWFFILLYALVQLEKMGWKSRAHWVIVGLSAGLFIATKPNFLFLVPLLGLLSLWKWRGIMRHKIDVMLAGTLMMAGVILFFCSHFGFDPRGWGAFLQYTNGTAVSEYVHMSRLALFQKNILRFFQESSPLLVAMSCLPWLVWTAVRVYTRKRVLVAEWVALGAVGVTVLYFSSMPPFYRYLLPAQLLAYAHLPVSLDALWKRWRFRAPWLMMVLFVALISFQTYQLVFDSWVQKYYHSHKSAELTAFSADLEGKSVLVYDAVELVPLIPHENYYQYFPVLLLRQVVGGDNLQALQQGKPDVVVLPLSRLPEVAPFLGAYKESRRLPEAGYIVFVRSISP